MIVIWAFGKWRTTVLAKFSCRRIHRPIHLQLSHILLNFLVVQSVMSPAFVSFVACGLEGVTLIVFLQVRTFSDLQLSFTEVMSSIPTASFFSSQIATTCHRSGSSSRPANNVTCTSGGWSSSAHWELLRDGAIRNRENLVGSNREICQLFDSMKEMGEMMKRQNAKLENMAAKLEANSKEVSELKEHSNQTAETDDIHCGPVPKELKVCGNFNLHWVALSLRCVFRFFVAAVFDFSV